MDLEKVVKEAVRESLYQKTADSLAGRLMKALVAVRTAYAITSANVGVDDEVYLDDVVSKLEECEQMLEYYYEISASKPFQKGGEVRTRLGGRGIDS